MGPVFRFKNNQPVVWYHRQLNRSNRYCLYCGATVADPSVPSNEEHLIGRAFGPDGAFSTGREFNFIFRACYACNGYKSALERHLSSITVFNSPARYTSENVETSAIRKASNDFHPADGRLIKDSQNRFDITSQRPGLSMRFNLVTPPQPDFQYTCELAFMHIQGLFSLVTSKDPTLPDATRFLPPNEFYLHGVYGHGDWGNTQLMEIVRRISNWYQIALINTANGFFRAMLLREGGSGSTWFWALEWNQALRLVGGITDDPTPAVFSGLPDFKWQQLDASTRMRAEKPIAPEEDKLFTERTPLQD